MLMLTDLRKDKMWMGLAILFSLTVIWPLTGTSFVPLHDLPDHVGLAALSWDILQEGSLAHQELALQSYPVPYWTLYLFIALSSPVIGALWAAKLFVGLCLLCLPWGVMRLLWVLGKDARLGLLSFLLVWDFNLSWGFVAYHLGVGLVFWALAALVRAEKYRDLFKVVPIFMLAALTHAQSYGILVLATVFLLPVLPDFKRRWRLFSASLFLGGAPLLPWLWVRATSGGGKGAPNLWARFHGIGEKIQKIFEYTVDILPAKTTPHLPGLILLFFFAAIVILMLVPQKRDRAPPFVGVALFILGLFLYFAMPHALLWPIEQWLIYDRHATFLLLTFIFLPDPVWDMGRDILLGCALLLQLVWMGTLYEHYREFGERAEPFKKIIEAVPENQAIVMLTLNDNDPAVKRSPYNQFHAYVVAEKGGYDPYLFDNKSHPVVHRNRKGWPRPSWRQMNRFSMTKHGKHYDYIIVQGLKKDPIKKFKGTAQLSVKQVTEAGRWRLYQVIRK
jgi:hypothetical protein